jgi:hypothetical protein
VHVTNRTDMCRVARGGGSLEHTQHGTDQQLAAAAQAWFEFDGGRGCRGLTSIRR